ncbi:hypothetical protein BBJ28_00007695 [Nothophytophthora sp. Chile5]|nr:hypothetical protein BBJ28_00007695 [Nothophytophthora sp. Chile5]
MASDPVTAAGALLWLTHALLREKGWALRPAAAQSFSTQLQSSAAFSSFAGDVNLLPAVRFGLPSTASALRDEGIAHDDDDDDDVDVHVRALVVGGKVFVHFVSRRKSVRVSLKCVLRSVPRNLFPEFSSGEKHEAQAVAADAELNRLPEPLLVRVGSFLHASEFCQVVQTSQKRMEAWVQQHRERRLNEYMLRLPMHWRWRVGGRRPAPPLFVPLTPPFSPLEQQPWLLPLPHPMDLFDDEDLELLPDPFAYHVDPRLDPHLY